MSALGGGNFAAAGSPPVAGAGGGGNAPPAADGGGGGGNTGGGKHNDGKKAVHVKVCILVVLIDSLCKRSNVHTNNYDNERYVCLFLKLYFLKKIQSSMISDIVFDSDIWPIASDPGIFISLKERGEQAKKRGVRRKGSGHGHSVGFFYCQFF